MLAIQRIDRIDGRSSIELASRVADIAPFKDGVAIAPYNAGPAIVLGDATTPLALTTGNAHNIFPFGDGLAFLRWPHMQSYELWVSDGTPAGTHPIASFSSATWLGMIGKTLFLGADTPAYGSEFLRYTSA